MLGGKQQFLVSLDEVYAYVIKCLISEYSEELIRQNINNAIKTLKIHVTNNKIKLEDAQKIAEYLQKNHDEIKQQFMYNEIIESTSQRGTSWFAWIIISGVIGYGGYYVGFKSNETAKIKYIEKPKIEYRYVDSNRYSIEQEFAILSTCVGEQASEYRKKQCINFVKQCQERDQDFQSFLCVSLILLQTVHIHVHACLFLFVQ